MKIKHKLLTITPIIVIKKIAVVSLAAIFIFSAVYLAHSKDDRDVLFQVSTLNALLDGVYDGEITYGDLKQKGDFGIGTFNALDGEMIGIDGKFYKVRADGIAYPVASSAQTPFAAVTFFEVDEKSHLESISDYDMLKQCLDNMLPTENIFYAIRIDGKFGYIQTRSVPKQSKPYPKLTEVTKNQPIFDFHNIEGTLVGFRCPDYVKGVNVPGYHFHFISKDKKRGGHLLQCQIKSALAKVDYTTDFFITLPKDEAFYKVDLTGDTQKEIKAVESIEEKDD